MKPNDLKALLAALQAGLNSEGKADLGSGIVAAKIGHHDMPPALAEGIASMGRIGKVMQGKPVDLTPSDIIVAKLFAEASTPDNTKAGATKMLRESTPEIRGQVAGVLSAVHQMSNQMLMCLAAVGVEAGDRYVEVVGSGCDDPDCENCGGHGSMAINLGASDGLSLAEALEHDGITEKGGFVGEDGPIAEIAKALRKQRKVS